MTGKTRTTTFIPLQATLLCAGIAVLMSAGCVTLKQGGELQVEDTASIPRKFIQSAKINMFTGIPTLEELTRRTHGIEQVEATCEGVEKDLENLNLQATGRSSPTL